MQQFTSHVDWSLSVILIGCALVQFVSYSIKMYNRRVMPALIWLGMTCISFVTAAGVSLPGLIREGAGIASLPVLACLVVGLLLIVVGVVGSIPSLIAKYLPRLSGKRSTAATTASHS
jgi:hypothetical protein